MPNPHRRLRAYLLNVPKFLTMAQHLCPYISQRDELNLAPGMQVRAGDVYTVRESVFTPIYDLLRNCLEGDLRSQASQAYHAKVTEQRFKRRPCILMQDYPASSTTPQARRLCLVGTLEHQPISCLPRIFREFCIPVFPHTCAFDDHIHSSPEWEPTDTWVVAIPFDSSRRLLGKWRDEHAGIPARTRAFGTEAMLYLKDRSMEKRAEWIMKCRQDPAFAREHFKECRVSLQHRQPQIRRTHRGAQDHKTPAAERSTDAVSVCLSLLSCCPLTSEHCSSPCCRACQRLRPVRTPGLRSSHRCDYTEHEAVASSLTGATLQINASMASLAHAFHKIVSVYLLLTSSLAAKRSPARQQHKQSLRKEQREQLHLAPGSPHEGERQWHGRDCLLRRLLEPPSSFSALTLYSYRCVAHVPQMYYTGDGAPAAASCRLCGGISMVANRQRSNELPS